MLFFNVSRFTTVAVLEAVLLGLEVWRCGLNCGGRGLLHNGGCRGAVELMITDVAPEVLRTTVARAESTSKVAGINYALPNRRGGSDNGYQRGNKSRDLVVDLSSSSFMRMARGAATWIG